MQLLHAVRRRLRAVESRPEMIDIGRENFLGRAGRLSAAAEAKAQNKQYKAGRITHSRLVFVIVNIQKPLNTEVPPSAAGIGPPTAAGISENLDQMIGHRYLDQRRRILDIELRQHILPV